MMPSIERLIPSCGGCQEGAADKRGGIEISSPLVSGMRSSVVGFGAHR